MVYVGTGDVEINLERIRNRVLAGGTAALCDFVIVFDNGGDALLPIAHRALNTIRAYNPAPPWSQTLVDALERQARLP